MIKLKFIKSSNDVDLLPGIYILNDNMTINTNINSNELIYWIDNYNKTFDDNFYCYVIKQYDNVIGWLQFVVFDEFVFVDYLVIKKEFRNFDVLNMVEDLLSEFDLPIVVECGSELERHESIVRLYKFNGFKQSDIDYIEPKLDVCLLTKKIEWLSVPSVLMYNGDLKIEIKDIIETIYLKHYYRWYQIYKFDLSKYKKFLKEKINDY